RLVAAQAEQFAGTMQSLNHFGSPWQELRAFDQDRGMMRPIARQIGREIAAGHRLRQQVVRPPADEALDLIYGHWLQAMTTANMIDAGRDRIVTVGERAIEIEDHRGE